MGTIRIINTDLWVDPLIQKDFTPEDKLFWVYLLTGPRTTQLGIYQVSPKQMAFDLGFSEDTAKNLLTRFQEYHERIIYDYQNCEVAILNYLRWSIVKGGKPVEDCLKADLNKVKNKKTVEIVYNHLCEHLNLNQKPFNEKILQILSNYLNENDNDNERFVPRFVKDVSNAFETFAADDQKLLETLREFEKMRNKIKKPMTDHAKELLIEGLKQLSSEGEDIIACINQSILNSWQGVFPVKEGYKNATNKKSDRKPTDDWGIKTNRL